MISVDWLHMGPEPYLATCERCGGHIDKPPMPTSTYAFIVYLDYAEELHAHCPQQPAPKDSRLVDDLINCVETLMFHIAPDGTCPWCGIGAQRPKGAAFRHWEKCPQAMAERLLGAIS